MRLRRLGLTRYGIFTDHAIDLGEPIAGKPDLHIVYGPNESGKSTALAGFLDLLFGFELRSRYAFNHGYNAIRVDADLQFGDSVKKFTRVRSRADSLRDSDERPIPESEISSVLGGLTRDTYRAMFSLDDDTLEAGGEEILNSQGDLGRLLFASGAGLVALSKSLNSLRTGAQDFHRPRARATRLHNLKSRLKELDTGMKALDTAASAYARCITERDVARAEYDKAVAERAKLEASRESAQRRLAGLDRLSGIRPLRVELTNLAALPEAPQVWFDQIGDLLVEEPRLNERVKGLQDQQTRLAEERDALPDDNAILDLKGRLDQLTGNRARFVTAQDDLPKRRASLSEYRGRISAILRRLSKPPDTDLESLVVPAGTVGLLNELIEKRSGVDERLKTAGKEQEAAESDFEAAEREFKQAAGAEEGRGEATFHRLSSLLDRIQADGFAERLELHTDQRGRLSAELDAQLEQLHPWSGDAKSLLSVRVPERSEMEKWQTLLDEAVRDIERVELEMVRLQSEQKRLKQLLSAKAAEADVIGDEEAMRLRELRDEAWVLHRSKLDIESANAFEDRMKKDDAAVAGRVAHATTLAELRHATEALRDTLAAIERSKSELSLALGRKRDVLNQVALAVSVMSRSGANELPPDIPLPKLVGWMERRVETLRILGDIDRENANIDKAVSDAKGHRKLLANAMKDAGLLYEPTVSLEELIRAAREATAAHKDQQAELRNARQRLTQAKEEFERRRRDAQRAASDDSAWCAEWRSALSSCWLGQGDSIPAAPEVRRILEDIMSLEGNLAGYAELKERVRTMERDQAAYSDDVKSLVEELGGQFDPAQPVLQGDGLMARLKKAIDDRKSQISLNEKIKGLSEKIGSAKSNLAEMNAVAKEMFEAFGVDSLRAANECLQRVAHRETVLVELSKREDELIASMNAESVASAEAELGDASRESLQAEIAEISARLDHVSGRTQELYHELHTAQEAIARMGGDDAVAKLSGQRQTCLLEIREGARAYICARLGIEAAERALKAYRDEHRSSMMERASEAFRTISRRAYVRLESQMTDRGEVLIGIASGGGSKDASQMSKGARFQLYLALRAAGYREFVDQHGPVPFVADDILETFDDFRAEEAFRLFSDMAGVGQVIYLSHHRHLCDIARDVCPNVSIHELPAP